MELVLTFVAVVLLVTSRLPLHVRSKKAAGHSQWPAA